MAIRILTSRPKSLVKDIQTAIDGKEVRTWEYDSNGRFNHTAPQWSGKAWIKPQIEDGKSVTFLIVAPDGKKSIADGAYAVFQGRFVEMLTEHFPSKFRWMAVGKVEDLPK